MKETAHSFSDTTKLVNGSLDSRHSTTHRVIVKGKKYEGSVNRKSHRSKTANPSLDFIAFAWNRQLPIIPTESCICLSYFESIPIVGKSFRTNAN